MTLRSDSLDCRFGRLADGAGESAYVERIWKLRVRILLRSRTAPQHVAVGKIRLASLQIFGLCSTEPVSDDPSSPDHPPLALPAYTSPAILHSARDYIRIMYTLGEYDPDDFFILRPRHCRPLPRAVPAKTPMARSLSTLCAARQVADWARGC